MKKLFVILTACALTLALGACSSGGTTPPSSSQAPNSSMSEPSAQARETNGTAESSEASSIAPAESEASQPREEPSSSAAEQPEPDASSQEDPAADPTPAETGKSLTVYFSWSGNTAAVAQEIGRQTGADTFEIVPATPYTDDYNTLLDIAQEERRNSARPAISGSVDLSGYDTVFLGFPCWWGDMPMILYTFLDAYDLSGKTVAPFVTSGGSGFSGAIDTIESMEPGAAVTDGLSLGSGEAANSSAAVAEWLGALGLA